MRKLRAEVEFYFVKSHFNKDKDIARNNGLSSSNDAQNYVDLLKKHLQIHNIKLIDRNEQYISKGAFGNKCSVTIQHIEFSYEQREEIEQILIQIVKEAKIYTVTSSEVNRVVKVIRLIDDNNSINMGNQNYQPQNQQPPIQSQPLPQRLPQQHSNDLPQNYCNFVNNAGQQICQNQNKLEPINNNNNNYIPQQKQHQQDSQNNSKSSIKSDQQIRYASQNLETRTNDSIYSNSSNSKDIEIQQLREEYEGKLKKKDEEIKRLKQDFESERQQLLKRIKDLQQNADKAEKQFDEKILNMQKNYTKIQEGVSKQQSQKQS
ncbi:hypothetical protein ABPG74_018459 [Tetrahymena malaccensis]